MPRQNVRPISSRRTTMFTFMAIPIAAILSLPYGRRNWFTSIIATLDIIFDKEAGMPYERDYHPAHHRNHHMKICFFYIIAFKYILRSAHFSFPSALFLSFYHAVPQRQRPQINQDGTNIYYLKLNGHFPANMYLPAETPAGNLRQIFCLFARLL